MMRSHADRMESESRLLETQRMLLRDQQELIQAERSALESAAWQAEWAHRRTEVLVDLLSEGQIECHTVVLSSVTGPLPSESVRNITELLSTHPSLEFVNPLKIRRRYRTHRALDEEFTRRPGVVQLQLHREPLNLHGRFVRVTVTDHTGRLIHEAHHENRHYTEMLDPLLGMGMR